MIFYHLDFIEKYTCYCKNGQNVKSVIKLIKINILMLFKSLCYIFLKVGENKVPLEFRFSLKKVDCLHFYVFILKKTKYGLMCTFYLVNFNSNSNLHNITKHTLKVHYVKVSSELKCSL